MPIKEHRRPGAVVRKRINIYLDEQTFLQVESIAKLRGITTGAAARKMVEERINDLAKPQAVAV